jgi:hypothetical protein
VSQLHALNSALTFLHLSVRSDTVAVTKFQHKRINPERRPEYQQCCGYFTKRLQHGNFKFSNMPQRVRLFDQIYIRTTDLRPPSRDEYSCIYYKLSEHPSSRSDADFHSNSWYCRKHCDSSRQSNDSIVRTNSSINCIPARQHHKPDVSMLNAGSEFHSISF